VILKGGGVGSGLLNAPLPFGFKNNSSSLGMLGDPLGASRPYPGFDSATVPM